MTSESDDTVRSSVAKSELCDRFQQYKEGIISFVSKAAAAHDEAQCKEDEAVAATVASHADELADHARESFTAIREVASVLQPLIQAGEPLAVDCLRILNVALQSSEARYGPSSKSDLIPEKLIVAEFGSKLYPALVKKVTAVLERDVHELQRREIAAFTDRVRDGGYDTAFDARRAERAAMLLEQTEQLVSEYASALSHSDHLETHVTVPLSLGHSILKISTWNVMEFPKARAAEPVLDGVNISCTAILHAAGYKSTRDRNILMEALASEPVIEQHAQRVLEFLRTSLGSEGSDVVFLQEIGTDIRDRIEDLCGNMGWFTCFSTGNDDPTKIDAITAIIAKESFDEQTEVDVKREGKTRHFAAARHGHTWFVSCHLPLSGAKRGGKQYLNRDERDEEFASMVLEQLWTRFCVSDAGCGESGGNGEERPRLVAGGDWNANLFTVGKVSLEKHPAWSSRLFVHASHDETCVVGNVGGPIDGILCLR